MDDSITPLVAANSSAQDPSSKETLTFNVGGLMFETYRSTLLRLPDSPLNNPGLLDEHYRPERKDYFFDKDPDAFKIILDYFRTGQLYIPVYVDRPSLRNDLQFWGLTSGVTPQTGSAGAAQQNNANLGNTVTYTTSTGNTSSTRIKIWNLLSDPSTSLFAKIYAALAYFLMFVSVLIMVFATTSVFHETKYHVSQVSGDISSDVDHAENNGLERETHNHDSVNSIAFAVNLFFTVEYIIRFLVAPKRVRFVFSFLGVIDVLAILPDYVWLILSEVFYYDDSSLIHILGVFRILRVLRVFKHFKDPLKTERFVRTFNASAGELVLVGCLFAVGTLVSATVVYSLELQGSVDSGHLRHIPEACWWAIITLTTVGYGDLFPLTPVGKVFSAFSALFGLAMIGFLVAVLVNNYTECSKQLQSRTKNLNAAYGYREVAECRPVPHPAPEGHSAL